jgi:hypothetical protein
VVINSNDATSDRRKVKPLTTKSLSRRLLLQITLTVLFIGIGVLSSSAQMGTRSSQVVRQTGTPSVSSRTAQIDPATVSTVVSCSGRQGRQLNQE